MFLNRSDIVMGNILICVINVSYIKEKGAKFIT
nr:MAG TPA: hypothetical protein [Caudoviricetes sp.]